MPFLSHLKQRKLLPKWAFDIINYEISKNKSKSLLDILMEYEIFDENVLFEERSKFYNFNKFIFSDDYKIIYSNKNKKYILFQKKNNNEKNIINFIAMQEPENLEKRQEAIKEMEEKNIIKSVKDISNNIFILPCSFNINNQNEKTIKENNYEELIEKAISMNASDIHLVPYENFADIIFRLDGVLYNQRRISTNEYKKISSQIKVSANLDIAQLRKPQSGGIKVTIDNKSIDTRISTHPTQYGESVVLRLLYENDKFRLLKNLNLGENWINKLLNITNIPQGLVVVSGPTGSGKTTTIYSILREMNSRERSIVTLEQPIEYRLNNIRQTEISENGVVSFSEGVRSILRQDPDIIFIGEIRDEETAKIAARAALTGHLVLTTIHAQSAYHIPLRLKNLGISPEDQINILHTGISQRLVRKLCIYCSGNSCEKCHGCGFFGRQSIMDICEFTKVKSEKDLLSPSKLIEIFENSPLSKHIQMENLIKSGTTSNEEIKRVFGYCC